MHSINTLVEMVNKVVNELYKTIPFQRQRYNFQLGFCDVRYPYDNDPNYDFTYWNYPRIAHMTECYKLGVDCLKRMVYSGETLLGISGELSIACYAHDVGHGHTSHALEGIKEFNHEEKGKKIMLSDQISSIVEEGGFDPKIVVEIFCDKLPPYSDFLTEDIGVDRLTYVTADSKAAGHNADFSDLTKNLFLTDDVFYLREGSVTKTMLQWFLHQRAVLIQSVYGSPANRSMATMYKTCFNQGLEEGFVKFEDAFDMILPQQYERLDMIKNERVKKVQEKLRIWYPFYGVRLFIGNDLVDEIDKIKRSDEKEELESEMEKRIEGVALIDMATLPGKSKLNFKMEDEGKIVTAKDVIAPEVEHLIDLSRGEFYVFVEPKVYEKHPHLDIVEIVCDVCGIEP